MEWIDFQIVSPVLLLSTFIWCNFAIDIKMYENFSEKKNHSPKCIPLQVPTTLVNVCVKLLKQRRQHQQLAIILMLQLNALKLFTSWVYVFPRSRWTFNESLMHYICQSCELILRPWEKASIFFKWKMNKNFKFWWLLFYCVQCN